MLDLMQQQNHLFRYGSATAALNASLPRTDPLVCLCSSPDAPMIQDVQIIRSMAPLCLEELIEGENKSNKCLPLPLRLQQTVLSGVKPVRMQPRFNQRSKTSRRWKLKVAQGCHVELP